MNRFRRILLRKQVENLWRFSTLAPGSPPAALRLSDSFFSHSAAGLRRHFRVHARGLSDSVSAQS